MSEDSIGKIIDMASRKGGYDWMLKLAKTKEGAYLPTAANAMIIFANDPKLIGLVVFDAFRGMALITRPPPSGDDGDSPLPGPYPRSWGVDDATHIQAYMQRMWSPKFTRSTIEDVMFSVARVRTVHPVLDWLNSLEWDGKSRLNFWLHEVFGCPKDDEYYMAVAAKFLIAAVRRVRQPGCKFDYMPVFEGLQGIGKSTALRELFGADRFSDSIHPDLSNKDAAIGLLGKWIIEFAEIEHLIRNEPEVLKAFLSRQIDRYREPYGKGYVDRPRQGVLAGTTNSDDYLRDSSGNRRIWPIKCIKVVLAYIIANREQLWAEAAAREATGETIWLDENEVQKTARVAQAERMTDDVWVESVRMFVQGVPETTSSAVLTTAIGMPVDRQSKRDEMRVANILRNLGWTRVSVWESGKMHKRWKAPKKPPLCDD